MVLRGVKLKTTNTMGTLQHIQHQIGAINDLIKINNDRVAGYQKAAAGTTDEKLQALFDQYIEQSKKYATELRDLIHHLGGDPADGTTFAGKFYRTWMDIKAKITKPGEQAILSDCEYGEDVANKAYRDALDDKELIWQDKHVVSLLDGHLKGLKASHQKIRDLRDAFKVEAELK
jgi:uncharacterized protein (TIGR02284 family)